ncbi:hypothetical protein [Sulfurimonas sp.]
MYKKIVFSSVFTLSILLGGCGNSDTTCRIDVQNALDDGQFDTAINLLEGSCSAAYSQSDLNLNLATAYMGKSGFGVSDVVNMIINSNTYTGDAFSNFLISVDNFKTPNSLPLLDRSNSYYLASIAEANKTTAAELCSLAELNTTTDSRRLNVCLYIGFNETIKAANTITYLTGDITTLVNSINNNTNTTPLDLQASLDALSWAIGAPIPNGSTVTASDVNISGTLYAELNVSNPSSSGLIFYRLARSSTPDVNNSTVLTDGYCDVNGSRDSCLGMEDNVTGAIVNPIAGCYACPVLFDNPASGDIAQLLVETMNSGSDAIIAASGDPDIQQAIADFTFNITGATDANVTITDILNYLNQ